MRRGVLIAYLVLGLLVCGAWQQSGLPIMGSTGAASGGGGIALVAHIGLASSTAGAGTITTSAINNTGATLLIACGSTFPGNATWGTGTSGPLSDSSTNTWNYLTAQKPGFSDNEHQCAYAFNPTVTGSQTFSFTTIAITNAAICAASFSGTKTTSAVFHVQNGATSNSAASLSTGNVTPSATNELLFTAWNPKTNVSTGLAVNNGFSILDTVVNSGGTGGSLSCAYLIDSASAAIAATWSITTADEMGVSISDYEHP